MMASLMDLPRPSELRMTGVNLAAEWKRFRGQWANYEVVTDLETDASAKRLLCFYHAWVPKRAQRTRLWQSTRMKIEQTFKR